MSEATSPRVLVVEDDAMQREVLMALLRHLGWDPTGAEHGLAALDRLAGAPFDAVLTDIRMPVLDGRALVLTLRERGFPGKIYVTSGSFDAREIAEYQALGVAGIFTKPLTFSELRGILPPRRA